MKQMWSIMRLEWMLSCRGKAIWVVVVAMIVLGMWNASRIRYFPLTIWLQFSVAALFMTVILVFVTGNQIQRDRDQRLDGVIFSTPILTMQYVIGKFLAGFILMLGLASVELLASIGMDALPGWPTLPLLGQSLFPALEPRAYLLSWFVLVIPQVLFGSALVLFGLTVIRGPRVVTYMIVLAIWLIPALLWGHTYSADHTMIDWFDLPGTSYFYNYAVNDNPLFMHMLESSSFPPSAELGRKIMDVAASDLPPSYLPEVFYWSRILFSIVSVLLVGATLEAVQRLRRGLE